MIVNLVVGVDKNTNGIGCKGGIPWKNKEDMQWFKKLTTGNACIMGWTTFVSLGRPLPNRLNIVISPDLDATTLFDADNSLVRNARSLEEAIQIAEKEKYAIAFVMGGGSIYKQYLEKDLIDTMYVDFIDNSDMNLEFDTFFPFEAAAGAEDAKRSGEDNPLWERTIIGISENGKNTYTAFHRAKDALNQNTVDKQYIDLLKEIKDKGQTKHTRAGETLSIFGKQLHFNAMNQLPTLTTKKMYSKGCIVELLWFISGNTNIKYLVDNGCNIWNDDAYRYYKELVAKHNDTVKETTKMEFVSYLRGPIEPISKEEFLERVKLGEKMHIVVDSKAYLMSYTPNTWEYDYQYGDLGPVYGKQWNNWNGINQIQELIDKLKNNPDDRRMIISAWNVGDLNKMALPPCHYMTQWYVTELSDAQRKMWSLGHNGQESPKYGLSVMWNQRSVDTCLGLPYNILSYSIFLYLVAQCVDMAPLEVICNLGDTHIYKNQLDGVEEQLLRNPFKFNLPKLWLNPDIKNIWDFKLDDIKIMEYESYPTIKFPLSVG